MSNDSGGAAPTALTVGSRFNGPPTTANGGYISGLLAGQLGTGAARVTLRRPPPLETAMTVERPTSAAVRLLEGGALVAEAETAPEPTGLVAPVPVERARRAERRFRGWENHPFPTCFVCGPNRERGDGLRLFAGPVAEGTPGTVACVWTPHASLPSGEGEPVPTEIVWAALDCPGGWSSAISGRPMVLGRMTAAVWAAPRTGDPHVVMGQLEGIEGRKAFTVSTVYGPEGEVLATARAVWITIQG